MKKLKVRRFLAILVLVLLTSLATISLSKEIIIRSWLEEAFQRHLNLQANIQEIYLNLFEPRITLGGLYLKNETHFGRHWLANISEIVIDYEPRAFLKRKLEIRRMKMDILEINIVKDLSGQINLNLIKNNFKESEHPFQLNIKNLYLYIRRVTYQDLTRNIPVRVYDLNIKNVVLKDVRTLEEVAHLVAVKIFERIGVGPIGVSQEELAQKEERINPIAKAGSFVEDIISALREAIPA